MVETHRVTFLETWQEDANFDRTDQIFKRVSIIHHAGTMCPSLVPCNVGNLLGSVQSWQQCIIYHPDRSAIKRDSLSADQGPYTTLPPTLNTKQCNSCTVYDIALQCTRVYDRRVCVRALQ